MTTADREEIENVLAAKRAELIQTIRGAAAKLTLDSVEADLFDHIQSMQGRDQVATMVNRFSATLEDVERSLQAVSEGSYGICAMCEEPIAPKRLKTIPWATYCVHCQERIEAEGTHIPISGAVVRQPALHC
jgi:DnaK suppressor protein